MMKTFRDLTDSEKREALQRVVAQQWLQIELQTKKPKDSVSNPVLAKEIDALKGAKPGTTTISIPFSKTPAGKQLKMVASAVRECESHVKQATLPSSTLKRGSSSVGIFKAVRAGDVVGPIAQHKKAVADRLAQIEPIYTQLTDDVRRSLGHLVDGLGEIFPPWEQWSAQAQIHYKVTSVDCSAMDRSGIMAEYAQDAQDQLIAVFENSLETAYERAVSALETAIRQTKVEYEDGKVVAGKVYDTTWDHLRMAAQLLREFNLFDDPKVEEVCTGIDVLLTHNIKAVRDNFTAREQMHKQAVDVHKQLIGCTEVDEAEIDLDW